MLKTTRLATFGVLCILLSTFLLPACKKTSHSSPTDLLQQYFDANIIGQIFIVSLATDSSRDLTANYNGYTFKLTKTDYYHGPLEAKYGSSTYAGTWSANEDYSKLIINLPSMPSIFGFLTREWRFTSKAVPELALAPWGSSAPVVLHMLRQ